MIDVRAGPTPDDRAFANLVRKRRGKSTILIANKSGGRGGRSEARPMVAYGRAGGDLR